MIACVGLPWGTTAWADERPCGKERSFWRVLGVTTDRLELVLDEAPDDREVEVLEKGLDDHALLTTGSRGFVPVAIYLRDTHGTTKGGVLAKLNWNWLFIDTLWVDESLRGCGAGSRLLIAAEDYGRRRGCTSVHLDTFSFQARPFYESHGYKVFATLEEYPTGHSRHYLRKRLSEANPLEDSGSFAL